MKQEAKSIAPEPVPPAPTAEGAVDPVTLVAQAWTTLHARCARYMSEEAIAQVKAAFDFADNMHQEQLRKSGEPYIIHPLAVADICADLRLDETSVLAAILHDVVEDTQGTTDDIEKRFGSQVASIVDGLTKLSKVKFRSSEERLAENFRKMILAMSKDIRVIMVKIADRLHNMRTIRALPVEKRQRIAEETIEIYAPLAGRMGMYRIKAELEDLCLKELKPSVYFSLVSRVAQKKSQREALIENMRQDLLARLAEAGIKATVVGRAKHFFSIYKKMSERQMAFEDIYDLFAVRVMVDKTSDCYEALGIIHSLYRPVPGRFKDYIAMPKANLYQSLHTTVLAGRGELLEVQIRTWEMHDVAENGIAAHWAYKESRRDPRRKPVEDQLSKFNWLKQMVKNQAELTDPNEFLEAVKIDLFDDEVYVFSPRGDVFELRRGATALDFAFAVHSGVGLRTAGAKINGRIVPLRTLLESGDVVEIITSPNIRATREWLSTITTSKARSKIRQYLRTEERDQARSTGEAILDEELEKHGTSLAKAVKAGVLEDASRQFSVSGPEDLILQVGYGRINVQQAAQRILTLLHPELARQEPLPDFSEKPVELGHVLKPRPRSKRTRRAEDSVRVQSMSDIAVRFAKCCQPLPGQPIIGFVSRAHGVTVHAADCEWALSMDPARRVDCAWNIDGDCDMAVRLKIVTHDKPGVLAGITRQLANMGRNIIGAEAQTTPEKRGVVILKLQVSNITELKDIQQQLEAIDGVIYVERLSN